MALHAPGCVKDDLSLELETPAPKYNPHKKTTMKNMWNLVNMRGLCIRHICVTRFVGSSSDSLPKAEQALPIRTI